MHAFFALVFSCLAVTTHGYPNIHVGGKDAPVGKYPYQVSLKKSGSHFCGGSIINQFAILTAAHCVVSYKGNSSALEALTIHAGTNLLNETGTVYKAKQVIVHSGFDSITSINDIGLLILSTRIQYSNYIRPIFLPIINIARAGTPCTLSGWGGRTSASSLVSNKLQEIELRVYDQISCKLNEWRILHFNICAGTKAGKGACFGDSGGPLVANDVQIGIVSYGLPCAVGSPNVYTKVSSYTNWIQKQLNDYFMIN